jgi:uncharacterized protein (TIGR02284 family)
MNTHTVALKDIVESLNDGRKFYEDAAKMVEAPVFQSLFRNMARTKALIANDFNKQIVAEGDKAPSGGTVGGTLRKVYGELAAQLSKTPNAEFVAQLEEFEDRIVAEFHAAAEASGNPTLHALVEKHMSEVLRDHEQMRKLKRAMRPH